LHLASIFLGQSNSYRVTVASDGKVTLEQYAEIPLSEKWIFENKELLEKVVQQMKSEQTKQL
jgi:hypothetical protein